MFFQLWQRPASFFPRCIRQRNKERQGDVGNGQQQTGGRRPSCQLLKRFFFSFFLSLCVRMRPVCCASVCAQRLQAIFFRVSTDVQQFFSMRVRMHDGWYLSGPSVCQLISISSFSVLTLFPLFDSLRPFNRVGSLTDTQHKVLDNSLNEP